MSDNEGVHAVCNKIIKNLKRELNEAHKCIADEVNKNRNFNNQKK